MHENKLKEWEKKLNLGKIGRNIAWCCCGASVLNMFVRNNFLQDVIFSVLAIAMLFLLLEDGKREKKMCEDYCNLMEKYLHLMTIPDAIQSNLIESDIDEEAKEKFIALVWVAYNEVIERGKRNIDK